MRESVSSIVLSLEKQGDVNIGYSRAKAMIEKFGKDKTREILNFYNQM